MSVMRVITGLWRNSTETSDRAKDPKLKTRYYKIGKRKISETITSVVNNKMTGWNLTHFDYDRGEMLIEKRGIRRNQIVITIVQVEPLRCSVDIVSAYDGLGDLGATYFLVQKFYEALNKEIPPVQKNQ
ncbi:hypothetical protein [Lederbergia galactosidilytica]|uniref:Uncharacterized protein n=1 Tax=Lederbergia galactosidilytica TaxID=217031 RepID=A0A177ZQN9_9BACI|nr:hypothetical protein [Lederbergia galactosidilytica]KRG12969.1 hypothetical protein ACA30_17385 [Virgibacillus soli]MBP1916202.1 hypothetical protein [Lederbergia galactosidilytica]OAK70165.1 hypothetical protein ABB05_12455 [Lederbergia galactosidilytica]